MKPTHWIGSSKGDLKTFPADVVRDVGYALHQAQHGEKSLHAAPLVGFRGAGVLEVISNFDSNTYRAVYTTRLSEAVFVLHCFRKKSKSGITTPPKDMNLVRSRLTIAVAINEELRKARLLEKHNEKPTR